MKQKLEFALIRGEPSQLVRETIKPALERGFCVITDRSSIPQLFIKVRRDAWIAK